MIRIPHTMKKVYESQAWLFDIHSLLSSWKKSNKAESRSRKSWSQNLYTLLPSLIVTSIVLFDAVLILWDPAYSSNAPLAMVSSASGIERLECMHDKLGRHIWSMYEDNTHGKRCRRDKPTNKRQTWSPRPAPLKEKIHGDSAEPRRSRALALGPSSSGESRKRKEWY